MLGQGLAGLRNNLDHVIDLDNGSVSIDSKVGNMKEIPILPKDAIFLDWVLKI